MTPVALPLLGTAAVSTTASAPLSLQPGAVLNARVLARIDDATVRLLLGLDTLDLKTDQLLAPGTLVELVVEGTPSQPQLILRARPELPAAPGTQNLAIAVAPRPTSSRGPVVESVVTTVAAFVGRTAVRQGSLAPLYANLESTLARLDLSIPQPVAAAARQLLTLRLDPGDDGNVDAAEVKAALQRSGLPADSGRSSGPQPASGQADLRAALQTLRDSLKTWAQTEPLPRPEVTLPRSQPYAAPLPESSDVPTPSRLFGPLPPIRTLPPTLDAVRTQAEPAIPHEAGQTIPQQATGGARPTLSPRPEVGVGGDTDEAITGIKTALLRSGLVPDPDAPDALPVRSGQADLRAALQALRETLQRWSDTGPPLRLDAAQAPPPRTGLQFAPHDSAPLPPFRNVPTVPQAPVMATVQADASPAEIVHQLLHETDAAIARHTLLQIASLPDDQGAGMRTQSDSSTHLTFDIPLTAGQGTAIAQLRIERDGAEQRAGGAEPVWRVNFSIDLEPIGPVHARISLTGDRAAVILRAEREESAERLAQDMPLLEAGLRRAELEPGTLLCRAGAPEAPPAAAGQFLDHAT